MTQIQVVPKIQTSSASNSVCEGSGCAVHQGRILLPHPLSRHVRDASDKSDLTCGEKAEITMSTCLSLNKHLISALHCT